MDWDYIDLLTWNDFLGNTPNVRTLDVSGHSLTELPYKIFTLTTLKILYCNKNKLTKLPKDILKLDQLQKFYCDDNLLAHNQFSEHQNKLQEMKDYFKSQDLILLTNAKKLLALLRIQSFISQKVIPNYYDICLSI